MKRNIVLLTVFVIFVSCEDVEKAFKDNEVIPDVISTVPDTLLEVEYTKTEKKVNLGNELAPKDVKDIPQVKYDAEPDGFYTLILTDPDAPSRKNPTRREWNHWLVVNIPGSKVDDGEIINEYIGAGPPKDSGLHRYIFLLFKQSGKLKFDEPHHSNSNPDRMLSAVNFVKKYNLGKPIAGNFFQAEFDDYVVELYKQLGISL